MTVLWQVNNRAVTPLPQVQARAAERKHEEQRLENNQLKSRLAMMQKEKEESQQQSIGIIKPTAKR